MVQGLQNRKVCNGVRGHTGYWKGLDNEKAELGFQTHQIDQAFLRLGKKMLGGVVVQPVGWVESMIARGCLGKSSSMSHICLVCSWHLPGRAVKGRLKKWKVQRRSQHQK
jgi:hypothetical protein